MCGAAFEGKRNDARFCSVTCRSKHFKIKNGIGLEGLTHNADSEAIKIADAPLEPLNNLVRSIAESETESTTEHKNNNPLPEKYITQLVQTDNLNYLMVNSELEKCRNKIHICQTELQKLNSLLNQEKNKKENGFFAWGAGSGAVLGYSLGKPEEGKSKRKQQDKSLQYAFWGSLLGLGIAALAKGATNDVRENKKKEALQGIEKRIADYASSLQFFLKEENKLIEELKNYPQQIKKAQQIINPAYTEALKQIETQKHSLVQNSDPQSLNRTSFETDKISSMQTIAGLKYQMLNFLGRWLEFFGQPQTNFFCVIHGMSGEGKTNFAIQFAKYLAENFGNVLYISGEEGFAPTFQQKIKALGADIPRLYAADLRTGQDILKAVPNKYHFIFIDSVNNMNIDPELMKTIRQKFSQSGIIAICQNTKDGKIRGSYQIVHDSDITVKVVKGTATTTKNRFKAIDKTFDVFAAYRK